MTEPSRAPVRVETDIEVRYAETDQMGVVHHANYVIWFELARTRLCSESGFHYADIEKLGYLLMVTGSKRDITARPATATWSRSPAGARRWPAALSASPTRSARPRMKERPRSW
jgi:hypothetical protein